LAIKMSGIGTRRCNRFIGELVAVTEKHKDLGEESHIDVLIVAEPLDKDNTKIETVRRRERYRSKEKVKNKRLVETFLY
jgi:hypothetical protein